MVIPLIIRIIPPILATRIHGLLVLGRLPVVHGAIAIHHEKELTLHNWISLGLWGNLFNVSFMQFI